MTTKIYHNPRCSKSRETLVLLESRGIAPEIIPYLEMPPSRRQLENIVKSLPGGAASLVRHSDAAKLGINSKTMGAGEIIDLILDQPSLMERPVVVSGKGARLGRPPESIIEIL